MRQPVPQGFNAFAYVVEGEGMFGVPPTPAKRAEMVMFGAQGDAVEIANSGAKPLSALLIAGKPLNEPMSRYGPFVMNTREDILKAIDDYNNGRLGQIPATVKRS